VVEKTGIRDVKEAMKRLKEEGYTNIYTWEDPPNAYYNWHTHPYEEVRWVLKGEITIGTKEKVYKLKSGDKLKVPAGTKHWAKVGEEGVVYLCGSKI